MFKKLFLPLIAAALLAPSCNNAPKGAHPEWTYDAVVYEMNVRQYTPEGTFTAAAEHLPRLKELGADVVWLLHQPQRCVDVARCDGDKCPEAAPAPDYVGRFGFSVD